MKEHEQTPRVQTPTTPIPSAEVDTSLYYNFAQQVGGGWPTPISEQFAFIPDGYIDNFHLPHRNDIFFTRLPLYRLQSRQNGSFYTADIELLEDGSVDLETNRQWITGVGSGLQQFAMFSVDLYIRLFTVNYGCRMFYATASSFYSHFHFSPPNIQDFAHYDEPYTYIFPSGDLLPVGIDPLPPGA